MRYSLKRISEYAHTGNWTAVEEDPVPRCQDPGRRRRASPSAGPRRSAVWKIAGVRGSHGKRGPLTARDTARYSNFPLRPRTSVFVARRTEMQRSAPHDCVRQAE